MWFLLSLACGQPPPSATRPEDIAPTVPDGPADVAPLGAVDALGDGEGTDDADGGDEEPDATAVLRTDGFLESLDVGDLTGDGVPDLAAVGWEGGAGGMSHAWVFPGPLRGTLDPSAATADVDSGRGWQKGTSPGRVEIADTTGDGVPDLFFEAYTWATELSGPVHGDSRYDEASWVPVAWVTTGDLDGDVTADIAAVGYEPFGHDPLWLATGPVLLQDVPATEPASPSGSFVALGDIDGDGLDDPLVAAFDYDAYVGSITGDVGGIALRFHCAWMATGDADDDGYDDLAFAAYSTPVPDSVAEIVRGSAGGLSDRTLALVAPGVVDEISHAAALTGDVEGDGVRDVVLPVGNDVDDSQPWLARVVPGDVDGTVDVTSMPTLPSPPATDMTVHSADADGDGVLDLLLSVETGGHGVVYVLP